MSPCSVPTVDLWLFALGRLDLDDHVAACDECQERLAELWTGSSPGSLVESVVSRLRPAG